MPGINLYNLKLQTDFTTGGRSETAFFFSNNESPVFNGCESAIDILTRSFCPNSKHFWKCIFHCFSEAFVKHWDPGPLIVIIGASCILPSDNENEKVAVLFVMVTAKKLILRM